MLQTYHESAPPQTLVCRRTIDARHGAGFPRKSHLATDSRFFSRISPHVYRFAPFRMTKEQRESIHSYDEHLGVEDFLAGVEWYRQLLRALS